MINISVFWPGLENFKLLQENLWRSKATIFIKEITELEAPEEFFVQYHLMLTVPFSYLTKEHKRWGTQKNTETQARKGRKIINRHNFFSYTNVCYVHTVFQFVGLKRTLFWALTSTALVSLDAMAKELDKNNII